MKKQQNQWGEHIMKIAILDDEAIYQEMITNIVSAYDSNIEIVSFSDANDLLEVPETIDLLLLDVEMPDVNGITFAKNQVCKFPYIIFVTSHEECVYDCFGTNVIGFVPKDKLQEQLIKRIRQFQDKYLQEVSFSMANGILNINSNKIYYIYLKEGCIYLKLKDSEIYVLDRSMKETMKKLPDSLFFMVNRQCIVSFSKVDCIHHKSRIIKMKNGDKVKVSRRSWNIFFDEYTRWLSLC